MLDNYQGHVAPTTKSYSNFNQSKTQNFGFTNTFNKKIIPLTLECSGRKVLYMLDEVYKNSEGKEMRELIPRDQFEYFYATQLELSQKFFDKLENKRKEKNSKDFNLVIAATELFMYTCIRFSQFNVFIDFNTLDKLTEQPYDQALTELYPLLLTSQALLNWSIINQTKTQKTHANEFKQVALKCLQKKNPPKVDNSLIKDFYYHYTFYRDTVLNGQKFTPWLKNTYEDVDAKQLKKDILSR